MPLLSCSYCKILRNAEAQKIHDAVVLETELDPELKTRVQVVGVFRPSNPGSPAAQVMQAFLETDVVTTGSLSIAQHIELQAQRLER